VAACVGRTETQFCGRGCVQVQHGHSLAFGPQYWKKKIRKKKRNPIVFKMSSARRLILVWWCVLCEV
jgi:hypothetical protein